MSKCCAKCSKTVYPLEELKCLDKIWHKGCFKCTECAMTLNMKTYKGFDKLPYCEAHIPKAKATTVADTPEMKRIQENTKIQSNAVYHAEFERAKGKFTAVTDDPELLRLKGNTKIISNVTYHGDLEKKKVMETKRTLTGEGEQGSNGGPSPPLSPSYMDELSSVPTQRYVPPPAQSYQQRPSSYETGASGDDRIQHQAPPHYHPPPPQQPNTYAGRAAQNVVYSSDIGGSLNANCGRKVGSIADYDPVNNYFGSLDQQRPQQGVRGVGSQGQSPAQHSQRHPAQGLLDNGYGVCYRALYDYEAQDRDEVSFVDGDLIINCTAVEEGWMTGTIQRSGRRGMLPANYVTPAN